MSDEAKNKVEALLFAVGKKISIDEIMKICDLGHTEAEKALNELIKDYDDRESPMMIDHEGKDWKLTVREKYFDVIHKVVSDIELRKSVTETLAVIAWKSPVLQSDVIKVRTNKAYDDIKELEESGFITKTKEGRSYSLKITDKFYEYFDVKGKDDIKKMFEKVKDKPKEPEDHEKLGGLDVYDEPPEEKEVHETGKLPEQNIEVVDVPKKEETTEKASQAEEKKDETTEEKVEQEEPEDDSEENNEKSEETSSKEKVPEETAEEEPQTEKDEEETEEQETTEEPKEDPLKEDDELKKKVDEAADLLGMEKKE